MIALTLILLSAAVAVILFFAAVVTPAIFSSLPREEAGRVIRVLFPRYYLVLGALTALAAITAIAAYPLPAMLIGLAAAGFVWARQVLRPKINRIRDAAHSGNPDAKREFGRLHRLSVFLNAAQLLMLVAALVWITLR
jgi:hypothetical protein